MRLEENASELGRYPHPNNDGYIPAATNEQGHPPQFTHRASTIHRDPFADPNPTPVYEEYSSSYRSSQPQSVASRQPNVGPSRLGSIRQDNNFQYRPLGSPPTEAVRPA